MTLNVQKKLSIGLLAAFLSLSSHASIPEWVSSEVLFNMMTGSADAKTGAGFYILGVYDATHNVAHCPKEKPTIAYLVDTTYAVLKLVDDKSKLSADHVITFWLSKKFPCTTI